MRCILLFVILFTSSLAEAPKALRIAAAANLSSVLEILITEYAAEDGGCKAELVLGSSGKLAAQIINQAPYDLFLSADLEYPVAIANKGLALTTPTVYCEGELILFSAKTDSIMTSTQCLLNPKVYKIALAKPELAPYGRAAKEYLYKAGLWDLLQGKLIFGDNVAQTLQFSKTGADFAFLPRSVLFSPEIQNTSPRFILLSGYSPIPQAMIVLKSTRRPQQAKHFADFVLSDQAQKILGQNGYRTRIQ